jgi:hypothetical protein
LIHYGQQIVADKFQLFDYESAETNTFLYGQDKPRELNPEKISKVPIALFSSVYDRVVNVYENRKWAEKIPAVFAHEELEGDHVSFLIGKDMTYMQKVLSMLYDINPPNFDVSKVTPPTKKGEEVDREKID